LLLQMILLVLSAVLVSFASAADVCPPQSTVLPAGYSYAKADYIQGSWACIRPGSTIPSGQVLTLPCGYGWLTMGTDGLLQSKRWTPDGTPEINKQWTIYTQQGYSFSYKKDGSLAGVANGGSMSEPMIFTYGSDGLFCVDSHNGHVVLFNGGPASLINPIFDHWGPGEDKWKYPPGAPLIGYPTFTADKPGMGPPISIDVSSCLGGSQVASEATSLNQPSFV
ncbi:hypothetical protein HDU79_001728, partial [Rhizoclosmatium sp. JEL0117]